MRYLLDTHTFLWFLADDAQLSPTTRSFQQQARQFAA